MIKQDAERMKNRKIRNIHNEKGEEDEGCRWKRCLRQSSCDAPVKYVIINVSLIVTMIKDLCFQIKEKWDKYSCN
jgi:hypothetical protein